MATNTELQTQAQGLSVGTALAITGSVFELLQTGNILFRGSKDQHRRINKNWVRTANYAFAWYKVVGWSIASAVFSWATAASPIMIAIMLATTTAVYTGRAAWAFFKWLTTTLPEKNDPQYEQILALRLRYRKDAIQHGVTALFSIACMALYFGLLFSPVGAPAIFGLSVAMGLIGGAILVYQLVMLWKTNKDNTTEVVPRAKALATNQDQQIIQNAKTWRASDSPNQSKRSFLNYQFKVDYPKVVSQLASGLAAIHYLREELQLHTATLQGLFDGQPQSRQRPKWACKIMMLLVMDDLLEKLAAGTFQIEGNDTLETAMERFLTQTDVMIANTHISPYQFQMWQRKGFQSFGRALGRVEDLYLGVEQLISQIKHHEFTAAAGNAPPPQPVNPAGRTAARLADFLMEANGFTRRTRGRQPARPQNVPQNPGPTTPTEYNQGPNHQTAPATQPVSNAPQAPSAPPLYQQAAAQNAPATPSVPSEYEYKPVEFKK